MTKFKIGDEVEVYVETVFVEREDILNGEKGIIIKDCGDYCRVKFNNKNLNIMNVKSSFLKPLTPKSFTKADLQDGDICTLRNSQKGVILGKMFLKEFGETARRSINFYNTELKFDLGKDEDIMQVIRNDKVVFKREEKKYHLNIFQKGKDGLNRFYIDKQKLIEAIKELIEDENIIKFEVTS